MSQLPSVGSELLGAGSEPPSENSLRGLDMDHFLKLMLTELQNQDPLNPLENDQLLQQISQIREVGATDRLTDTLDAVLLGQNVSSATGLIGKSIEALDSRGNRVGGTVDRVSIADGEPTLHVGDAEISLNNVVEIRTQSR